MRIARPKPPETTFRRKRAPPPQATKFLTASMAAGLVFIVLLAAVFIPRGLDQNPVPSAILTLRIATGPAVFVENVTFRLDVTNFRAALTRDSATLASLDWGLGSGNATLRFVDADADGRLSPGDRFPIDASVPGRYRFEVFQKPDDRRVGFSEWSGSL